jgi:NTE family protein
MREPRTTRRRRYAPTAAVVVAAFGAFLAFLDSTVVNVAFPDIQAAFPHANVGTLSWVLNAYNVVFAGLLVLSGRFADLLGRRRLFKMGLIVFTVMSVLCAVSTSIEMLIVFRVLQGAGAAMLVPASLGIVVHASPLERRNRSLSLWAASAALAAGLGPPIGGALVDAYNWRMVFLINLPLGILAWVLARRMVIESRAPGRRIMPDLRGALVLSLAIAALTLGIVQGGSWGWSSAATVVSFAVAAIGVALTVQSSRHHQSPILDPDLLRIRAFTVSNLVTLAVGLGLYTYLLAHILWLHYVWGYSLLLAGLAVAPGAVVAAILAPICGRLADRFGPRVVVVPGALIWAGAYVWYATRVGLQPDFVGEWLPGQILSGIGVGATVPVAAAGGLSSVPAGQYATASAVNSSTRQIGGVLGIAILTIFIAHPTLTSLPNDLRHGWELAAASFAAAAVIALFFGRVRVQGEALAGATGAPLVSRRVPEPIVTTSRPAPESDLLGLLPPDVRDEMLSAGVQVDLRAGQALFHAGDPGDTLYLLRSGRVDVRRPDGSSRELYPGATIGELALLTGAPRAAAVVARRDSTLIAIDRDGFEALAARQPAVVGAVAKGLAQQLQASRLDAPTRTPVPRVISLVALDGDAPVEALAETIKKGLDRRLRVAVLDAALAGGLQRAEDENDRVLLVSGAGGEEQAAAIRQADRIVLTASAPGPTLPDGFGFADLEVPCDVVLTGAAPTQDDVVSWHDRSGCRRVYHLGEDRAAWDERLRPLLDRFTQSSVALVLGGGGARALAHLGVLHAFERAGITIDRLAGTSIGALIAALSATGAAASEVEERIFEEFVQRNPFGDYRLSLTSLARGERARALLRRCFGDRRVETLPRELVVASTDLYERVPVYHRRGVVADVVGASMCMPVLLPPRRLEGRVLVDGTLADNCPTAAFAELEEGPVVAVRIASGAPDPHESRTPSLGETLLRIVQMGDRGARLEEPQATATVAVTPDAAGVGLLEFHQIEQAREAGLRAGEEAIAALEEATRTAPPYQRRSAHSPASS